MRRNFILVAAMPRNAKSGKTNVYETAKEVKATLSPLFGRYPQNTAYIITFRNLRFPLEIKLALNASCVARTILPSQKSRSSRP
jgi:hypothetical protein